MIFSNFISGSKLDEQSSCESQAVAAAAACASLGFLEGATYGTVNKLRRLMQVSSSKLVGKQQEQQLISGSGDAGIESAKNTGNGATATTTTETTATVGGKINNSTGKASEWQLEYKYTLNEIQQHNSLDDCWMVIFDKVYNITEFVNEHPGGDFILLEYAGRDATHPFLSSRHGSSAYKMLDKYWIGILVDEELYYSNNSSYCSVYSNLSWRKTTTTIAPTLEDKSSQEVLETATAAAAAVTSTDHLNLNDGEATTESEEKLQQAPGFSATKEHQQQATSAGSSTTATTTTITTESADSRSCGSLINDEQEPQPKSKTHCTAYEQQQLVEFTATTKTIITASSAITLTTPHITHHRELHQVEPQQQQYPFEDDDDDYGDDTESGVNNDDDDSEYDYMFMDEDDEFMRRRGCHTCCRSHCLRRYH